MKKETKQENKQTKQIETNKQGDKSEDSQEADKPGG